MPSALLSACPADLKYRYPTIAAYKWHIGVGAFVVVVMIISVVVAVSITTSNCINNLKHVNVATNGSCIPGWLRGPGDLNSNCYQVGLNLEGRNWVQADQYCRNQRSMLLTIHSLAEKEFITSQLKIGRYANYTWKGAYLALLPGPRGNNWYWSDTLEQPDASILSWRPGQPDGGEWCANFLIMLNSGEKPVEVLNNLPCEQAVNASRKEKGQSSRLQIFPVNVDVAWLRNY